MPGPRPIGAGGTGTPPGTGHAAGYRAQHDAGGTSQHTAAGLARGRRGRRGAA